MIEFLGGSSGTQRLYAARCARQASGSIAHSYAFSLAPGNVLREDKLLEHQRRLRWVLGELETLQLVAERVFNFSVEVNQDGLVLDASGWVELARLQVLLVNLEDLRT